MDGTLALKYARCRKGNCGNDFGRAERQQQVIAALKQKMLKANILANPKKLTDLLAILGNHVRTDMSPGDIKVFWDSVKDLDMDNIINEILDTSVDGPLTGSTSSGGASILVPKKGMTNFTDLQEIAKNIFNDETTIKDKKDLKIEVLNGSGKPGQGTQAADALKKLGYNITNLDNTTKTPESIVYNCGGLTSQSEATKISESVHAKSENKSSCGSVDIRVIIGQDALTR